MNDELTEVLETLERIRYEFEDLAVGGLRAVGPERVTALRAMTDEFSRIGASHIADRLRRLAESINDGERSAAEHLMRAQASIRIFERTLTLEIATAAVEGIIRHAGNDEVDADDCEAARK